MSSLRSFHRFPTEVEADELVSELASGGINASVHANVHPFNASVVGQPENDFHVMLDRADFDRAHALIDARAIKDAQTAGEDHPLFGFTNEELMEVLARPDDSTRLDVRLAQRLLHEHGIPVHDAVLDRFREERMNAMRAPEGGQFPFVALGYISALCGGLLGIAIGWYLGASQKTLPNGDRVAVFSESDRRDGRRITIVGCVMLIVWVVIGFREFLFG